MGVGGNRAASTEILAADIARRLKLLPHPRSIAEIRLSDDDYRSLTGWARRLSASGVYEDLRSFRRDPALDASRVEQFGLVLLALIAEAGRRNATDGEIWPTTRRALSAAATRELFTTQGQPNQLAKDALELAARRWQLRHAFDEADTQAWYVTAYLQFGLTLQGIRTRLPYRLSGWELVPRAAAMLLEDPVQGSELFRKTWNALRSYRAGNMMAAAAKTVLGRSPWILLEWEGDVLKAARARRELGTVGPEPGGASAIDQGDPGFLSVPALRWDGTKPMFEVTIVGLAEAVELQSNRTYQVEFGGGRALTLPVTEDGFPGPIPALRFDAWPPELVATIIEFDEDGQSRVVGRDVVPLWNPRDEVAAFRSNGREFDPYEEPISVNSDYSLLLAKGLMIEPEPVTTYRHLEFTAVRLAHPWSPETRVLLDGHVIWEPSTTARPDTDTRVVCLNTAPVAHTDPIRFRIVSARGLPSRVSIDGKHVKPEWERGVGPVVTREPFGDEGVRPSVAMRISFGDGGPRVSRQAPVPCRVVDYASPDGWRPLLGDVESMRGEDLNTRVRAVFREPFAEKAEPGHVFLGSRLLKRCGTRGRNLGSLSAHGEPLLVRSDPFLPDAAKVVGAGSVWSGGLVRAASVASGPMGMWTFEMDGGAKWRSEHALWLVDQTGTPVMVGEDRIAQLSDGGLIVDAADLPSPAALVVSFRGQAVGQKWIRWPRALPANGDELAQVLRIARSAEVPIAALGSFKTGATKLRRDAPTAVVREWMLPPRHDDLPWRRSGADDGWWYAAMRHVFFDWLPSPASIAGALAPPEGGRARPDEIAESVHHLLAEFPVQAHSLLGTLVDQGRPEFVPVLECLRLRLHGRRMTSEAVLAGGLSTTVDPRFIDRLPDTIRRISQSESPVPDMTRAQVALNLSPLVRQFVAAGIVEDLLTT